MNWWLCTYFFQEYISYDAKINDIAKSLLDKFPEYNRIEFEELKIQVEDCCNELLEDFNKLWPSEQTPEEPSQEASNKTQMVSFKFRDIDFKRFLEPANPKVNLFFVYPDSYFKYLSTYLCA